MRNNFTQESKTHQRPWELFATDGFQRLLPRVKIPVYGPCNNDYDDDDNDDDDACFRTRPKPMRSPLLNGDEVLILCTRLPAICS